MNKKDFYTGLVFLVFTGIIFAMIVGAPSVQVTTKPGPFFFPSVAAVILGGLSISLLVSGARQKDSKESGKKKVMMNRVAWIIAWCLIYAVTIERIGYLVSTAVVTFALLWYFNRRSWVFNTAFAVATPVSIFILFDTLLKVSLPRGFLGF
ncbi:MAG TPA: tripartite tricarboxylate transporter TctB family protein [Thermodesulfobacteriota bacterium]|nr:tripartite tricarboxylate transporter TctB family protein [Thermodesulfobacteriota bacterium]